jgi:hypothetical protein
MRTRLPLAHAWTRRLPQLPHYMSDEYIPIRPGQIYLNAREGPWFREVVNCSTYSERRTTMEASVNRVELLGRTGNQPTLRQTPSGTPLTQFSVYTHQLWRNAADQLCEATERHTVTA